MAEKQKFFEKPVDVTPYGWCAGLAIIIGVCFILAASGLWKTASYLKHRHFLQLPSLTTSGSSNDLLDQVKDAASNGASSAAEKARQQAESAAKAEAQKQLDEQKKQLQDQTTTQLKNFSSQ